MVVKFNKGKIMDYNSDRPIESANQDLLGRLTFSKQLAEAIFKYGGKDGLVIGLFGKWGTGKTSILNIVVNEINSLSEDSSDKPIIVKFSPWNYTDKYNLISLFFRVLKNKLDIDNDEEKRKKIGNNKKIRSVAILGGSGADFIYSIPEVDIYLTGDVGYHAALDAIEMKKNIIDIGHFSEHLVKELLQDYISELNIVVEQSSVEKSPFVIL